MDCCHVLPRKYWLVVCFRLYRFTDPGVNGCGALRFAGVTLFNAGNVSGMCRSQPLIQSFVSQYVLDTLRYKDAVKTETNCRFLRQAGIGTVICRLRPASNPTHAMVSPRAAHRPSGSDQFPPRSCSRPINGGPTAASE
jgi:hypothetical protein